MVDGRRGDRRASQHGGHLFAAKLHCQENEHAKDDWRAAFKTLRLEATELPAHVAERCIALMRKLGIIFGCFDFIVTPDEEYVFLEVNPMGQFREDDAMGAEAHLFLECVLRVQRAGCERELFASTARADHGNPARLHNKPGSAIHDSRE